jgi:hypothetical protein
LRAGPGGRHHGDTEQNRWPPSREPGAEQANGDQEDADHEPWGDDERQAADPRLVAYLVDLHRQARVRGGEHPHDRAQHQRARPEGSGGYRRDHRAHRHQHAAASLIIPAMAGMTLNAPAETITLPATKAAW